MLVLSLASGAAPRHTMTFHQAEEPWARVSSDKGGRRSSTSPCWEGWGSERAPS